MKYYKDNQNLVYAYELDGSQDHLIGNKIKMSDEEYEEHIRKSNTGVSSEVREAIIYLKDTDYKMTVDYFASMTKQEQLDVSKKRAEAREIIRANKG